MSDFSIAPEEMPAQKAAEQAFQQLREDILASRFGPNERLTEAQLSERLNLSRTPIREAIRRLMAEGLLSRKKGEGLRVVEMGPEEANQIFQIRLLLETYAARNAALSATPDQIEEMRYLADMIAAHTPPRSAADMDLVSRSNSQFHRLIMTAARTPRIADILSSAIDIGLVMRTFHKYSERDLMRSARHHQELVDAIEARAPEWAAAVMTSHLHAAAVTLRDNNSAKNRNPSFKPGPDET